MSYVVRGAVVTEYARDACLEIQGVVPYLGYGGVLRSVLVFVVHRRVSVVSCFLVFHVNFLKIRCFARFL